MWSGVFDMTVIEAIMMLCPLCLSINMTCCCHGGACCEATLRLAGLAPLCPSSLSALNFHIISSNHSYLYYDYSSLNNFKFLYFFV